MDVFKLDSEKAHVRKGCKTCTYGYTAMVAGIEWFICDVSRAFREQIVLKEREIVEQMGCDCGDTFQLPFKVRPGFDATKEPFYQYNCPYYSYTAPEENVRKPMYSDYVSWREAEE